MDVREVGTFLQELTAGSGCPSCASAPSGLCTPCTKKAERARKWRRARVATLLTALFAVCIMAGQEWQRRNLGWDKPQRLAVILLDTDGSSVSPRLANKFSLRARQIEEKLLSERRRYDSAATEPVELSVFGPIPEAEAPPTLEGSSLWDLLVFNLKLDSYAKTHDERLGFGTGNFDVRIYVRMSESNGARDTVEGVGQDSGSIGIVNTRISEQSTDFAWFVVIHEYFHTRGASDKYDSAGYALFPTGHAEPEQYPLYPQQATELMARGRPLSRTSEEAPGPPETWKIGRWTAEEIGWVPSSNAASRRKPRHASDHNHTMALR